MTSEICVFVEPLHDYIYMCVCVDPVHDVREAVLQEVVDKQATSVR